MMSCFRVRAISGRFKETKNVFSRGGVMKVGPVKKNRLFPMIFLAVFLIIIISLQIFLAVKIVKIP